MPGSTLPVPAVLHVVMGECRSGTVDEWDRLDFLHSSLT